MYPIRSIVLASLTCGIVAMQASSGHAAILASQGFEGAAGDTWAYSKTGTTYSSGSVSNVTTSATESPANARIRTGSYSFQDTTTTSSSGAGVTPVFDGTQSTSLSFSPISLVGKTSASIQVHIASISLTSGNGADSGDNVSVFVATNGGVFSSAADLMVRGNANARWAFNDTGVASTTAGTPLSKQASAGTTNGFSTLNIAIPDGFSSIALKIVATNDNTGEIWAIDDVSISAVPEPATLGLAGMMGVSMLLRRHRQS